MACIPEAMRVSLIQSIDDDRLVIVAGAGLSMAPPSGLPSAKRVAQLCYDTYAVLAPGAISAELRDNLDAIAEHFMKAGTLPYFLRRVVDWNLFARQPNSGHIAIADMVICGAVAAVVTTNYDWLVERVAHDLGVAMETALNGDEAVVTHRNSPFLKVHGCSVKAPFKTVWAPSQVIDDPVVAALIENSKVWLAANLREKDFIFVGYWSDWDYLNEVLTAALKDVAPACIILVNLDEEAELATKANDLWNALHKENVAFTYMQCSGADFLDELRVIYSAAYVRKAIEMGKATYEHGGQVAKPIPVTQSTNSETLYAIRRDAEGVPRSRAAEKKWPEHTQMFGVAHYLLNENGAIAQGADYQLGDESVRVINGAGREVAALKEQFAVEPASLQMQEIVVCAGASEFEVPANIVREGRAGDLVRPAAGGLWLTLEKAREHFNI